MRFLALGDSYTCGEGVTAEQRWPDQLASMLRKRGIDIAAPQILARTAWTSDELTDAIDAEDLKGPYDLVTLLIGVNDQYRSRPVSSFMPEYKQLLRRAKRLAGNKVKKTLALSIPDWGATPYAAGRDRSRIGGEIEAYNTQGRVLAEAAGTRWVDITTISRDMLTNPTLVAPDGLHPSIEMYRLWADLLMPIALSILSKG